MPKMRAKMIVSSVTQTTNGEVLKFNAVCKSSSYGSDGLDDDNTFAKFSPSASLEIHVANPALFGQFKPGEKFYVDFTAADVPAAVVPTPAPVIDSAPEAATETPAPTETVSSVDAPVDTGGDAQ